MKAERRRFGAVEIDRRVVFRAGASQSSWRSVGQMHRVLRTDRAGLIVELSVLWTSRVVDGDGGK